MAIFNKEKKEERQQERATKKEERATMKRAEALASTIDTKSTKDIPSFDAKKEEERVMKSKQPGLTVVEGGNPMTNEEQKVTRFSPEQAKEIEKKEESKVQTYRGPVASIINATQAITANSDALKKVLSNDNANNAANSALNTLSTPPKSGEIILNSVYNDPNSTPEDIKNAKNLAEVADKEEEKEKTNLKNEIYQGPGSSNQNLIQNVPNATSSTLTTIGEQQGKPSFETTGTKEQVSKGIDDQYKKEADFIPTGVIEKLGVQDYYPQVGRDVGVGTFTGSRIGSQTIYSGAGVLLPQGLYDARKRALASAAQEKQKKIEEYLKIGDTLSQFNREYKNYAYNTLVKYAEKHKYNPNALFKDREFMNEKYRLETLGKEIEYVGGIVDGVFEKYQSKDGKPGSFVPDDVMKDAIDFRSGVADMDAVLSGKSRILDVGKRLRTYTNGTTWADGRLSEWKSKPTELPINLKNQEKMTIKDLNKIQDEIKRVKISGDHDSYVTAISKHYKLDPQVIDSWISMNMPGASDKDKEFVSENLNKYILSQMPDDSIETKIESLNNQNFERWKTRGDWAREDEKAKSFFTIVQDEAKRLNVSGKAVAISNNWNNKSQDQKQNELAGIYNGLGIVTKNPNNKKDAYAEIKVDTKTAIGRPVTISLDDPNAKIRLRKVGGGYGDVSIGDAARNLYDKESTTNEIWVNGVKYSVPRDSNDYTSISNAKKNKEIVVIDNSKQVRLGHYGSDGNLYNLSTDNLNNYVKSNKKTLNVSVIGNSAIEVEVPDYEENGKTFYKTELQPSSSVIIYKGDLDNTSFKSLADYTQGVGQQSYVGGEVKKSVEK
jgi:hypothetical protein